MSYTIKTGRTRTMKYTGTISGKFSSYSASGGSGQATYLSVSLQFLQPSSYQGVVLSITPNGQNTNEFQLPTSMTIGCQVGMQTPATNTWTVPAGNYTQACNGTFEVDYPLEECIEYVPSNNQSPTPPYGDALNTFTIRTYEQIPAGATINATITALGYTSSQSGTIANPIRMTSYAVNPQVMSATWSWSDYPNIPMAAISNDVIVNMKCTWTGAGSSQGTDISYPYTSSTINGCYISTANGIEAYSSAPAFEAAITYNWNCVINPSISPNNSYNINGAIYHPDNSLAYGYMVEPTATIMNSTLTAFLPNQSGGIFTFIGYQGSVSIGGYVEDIGTSTSTGFQGVSNYAYGDVGLSITPASLMLNGDEATDTRVFLHAFSGPFGTITWTDPYPIDDYSQFTQTNTQLLTANSPGNTPGILTSSGTTTLSMNGSALVICVGSSSDYVRRYQYLDPNQATGSVKPIVSLGSSRYLSITLKILQSDNSTPWDGQSITINIVTRGISEGVQRVPDTVKSYIVKGRVSPSEGAPDGSVTRIIDLFNPVNRPASVTVEGGETGIDFEWSPYQYTHKDIQNDYYGTDHECNTESLKPVPVLDPWLGGVTCFGWVHTGETNGDNNYSIEYTNMPATAYVYVTAPQLTHLPYGEHPCTMSSMSSHDGWNNVYRKDEIDSVLPNGAWYPGALSPPDPPMNTREYAHKFFTLDANGKLAFDIPDGLKIWSQTSQGNTLTYTPYNASQMAGINGPVKINNVYWSGTNNSVLTTTTVGAADTGGWKFTYNSSVTTGAANEANNSVISPADWLNYNRPMTWIEGAGLVTGETINASQSERALVDIGAGTQSASVFISALADYVCGYPDCGDAFQIESPTPSYGGALVVPAHKIIRGAAKGVFVRQSKPYFLSMDNIPEGIAYQYESSGSYFINDGFGYADYEGKFLTQYPFGPGGVSHSVVFHSLNGYADTTSNPHVDFVGSDSAMEPSWHSAKFHRAFFWYVDSLLQKNNISALFDYTNNYMIAYTAPSGVLLLDYYDQDMSSKQTFTIDDSTPCTFPSLMLMVNQLSIMYLIGGTPCFAVSYNHGATWNKTELTGMYQSLTSTAYKGRYIAMLYDGTNWNCSVGVPNDSTGAVTWSTPISTGISTSSPYGDIRVREDGVYVFAYVDSTGNNVMKQCYCISDSGSGTWS